MNQTKRQLEIQKFLANLPLPDFIITYKGSRVGFLDGIRVKLIPSNSDYFESVIETYRRGNRCVHYSHTNDPECRICVEFGRTFKLREAGLNIMQ